MRYPLSADPADQYGDAPALPPRGGTSLARFGSSDEALDAVWPVEMHGILLWR